MKVKPKVALPAGIGRPEKKEQRSCLSCNANANSEQVFCTECGLELKVSSDTKICTFCLSNIDAQSAFCSDCGNSCIESFCDECSITSTGDFCNQCGKILSSQVKAEVESLATKRLANLSKDRMNDIMSGFRASNRTVAAAIKEAELKQSREILKAVSAYQKNLNQRIAKNSCYRPNIKYANTVELQALIKELKKVTQEEDDDQDISGIWLGQGSSFDERKSSITSVLKILVDGINVSGVEEFLNVGWCQSISELSGTLIGNRLTLVRSSCTFLWKTESTTRSDNDTLTGNLAHGRTFTGSWIELGEKSYSLQYRKTE